MKKGSVIKEHKKDKRERKGRISIWCKLLCICICMAALVAVFFVNLKFSIYKAAKRLDNAIVTVERNFKNYMEDWEHITDKEEKMLPCYLSFFTQVVGKEPLTQETLYSFDDLFSEISIFYITDQQEIWCSASTSPLEDAQEIIEDVKQYPAFMRNGEMYSGIPYQKGWLIARMQSGNETALRAFDKVEGMTKNVLFWDKNEDSIWMASDSRLVGMTYDKFFGKAEMDDMDLSTEEDQYHFGINSAIGLFISIEKPYDDSTVIITYTRLLDIFLSCLRSLSMAALLIPIVIVTMIFYASKIIKKERPNSKKKKHIVKNLFLDMEKVYHMSALLVVCGAIAIVMTAYLQLLSSLSDRNMHALDDLEGMSYNIEEYEQQNLRLTAYYDNILYESLQMIAWGIKEDQTVLSQEVMDQLTEELEVEEIAVFDEYDNAVSGTSGRVLKVDYTPKENEEGISVNREDAGGWLRMIYDTREKQLLLSHSSFQSAFDSADFGEAYKAYAETENPDAVYLSAPGEKRQTERHISMTSEFLENSYSGIVWMNTAFYYINTSIKGDKLLVHALLLKDIFYPIIGAVLIEFAAFFIVYLILMFSIALRKEVQEESTEQNTILTHLHNLQESMTESVFKKSIHIMLFATSVTIVAIFALDAIFSKYSVFSYLLSNSWNTGLNLFSITKILLVIIFSQVLVGITNNIIHLVSGSLGTRGVTIGHMLSSMLKFGQLILVVFYTLVQLGFQLNSLLAGAGLAGAAIAIAGQSVVNDLLSGFFVVFEGQVGVGDWVTVDGWRGQVTSIGVRTTCIECGGDKRLVHNSDLNGITVWSRSMSGAVCYFRIAYKEDIDRVIELIDANQKRYQKEIPYILEGPVMHGVTDLGDNGVELRMSAYIEDQNNAMRAQREMLRVTKNLFDENGIEIPFPQVVIHQGK